MVHAVSAEDMQRIDTHAIEALGIPRLLLMEHAGLAVARAVRTLAPCASTPILVCCGTGFNGGDGLAAARHLHDWGYPLQLVLAGRLDHLREEPAIYAAILRRLGLSLLEFTDPSGLSAVEHQLSACGLILDGLLGIGARGPVREPARSLIALLNRSGKPIVSIDLPSGLDADTGAVQGIAVKATTTVTFGVRKLGCLKADGPAHAGSLIVDPITIPHHLLEP